MKINVILSGLNTNQFNKDSGGIELAEISFAKEASKHVEVKVYARSNKTELRKVDGLYVQEIAPDFKTTLGGISESLPYNLKLINLLGSELHESNNIIHFTSVGPASVFFNHYLNYLHHLKVRSPVIFYTLHNYHYAIANSAFDIFKNYQSEWKYLHNVEKNIILEAGCVLVTCEDYAEELTKRFHRKIEYIPNTIGSIHNYDVSNIKTPYHVILSISRLSSEKNLFRQIAAFRKALNKDKHIRLIIAGDGQLLKSLVSFSKIMKLRVHVRNYTEQINNIENMIEGNDIIFTGRVSGVDKSYVWNLSDVLLCPSLREVSPLIGLEAMVYGKTIIGSKIPGWIDYYKKGAKVYLTNPLSTIQIAKNIINTKEEESKEVMYTNHKIYKKYYSPEKVVPIRLEICNRYL